jgi:dipeptidase D
MLKMEEQISKLEPSRLWHYFLEICKIPHPSKKEDRLAEYLLGFANEQGLEGLRDETGNVLIRKAGTPGYENRKMVILQSHLDMVCEKNSDTVHDFDRDPIQPWIDGDWIKAKGTTLGADDGIGIAAALAILEAKDIAHGPLDRPYRCVRTETGPAQRQDPAEPRLGG